MIDTAKKMIPLSNDQQYYQEKLLLLQKVGKQIEKADQIERQREEEQYQQRKREDQQQRKRGDQQQLQEITQDQQQRQEIREYRAMNKISIDRSIVNLSPQEKVEYFKSHIKNDRSKRSFNMLTEEQQKLFTSEYFKIKSNKEPINVQEIDRLYYLRRTTMSLILNEINLLKNEMNNSSEIAIETLNRFDKIVKELERIRIDMVKLLIKKEFITKTCTNEDEKMKIANLLKRRYQKELIELNKQTNVFNESIKNQREEWIKKLVNTNNSNSSNSNVREQRVEQQELEQQELEQQRVEQQELEQQRLEQQRVEQQRLEQQRVEQQKLENQVDQDSGESTLEEENQVDQDSGESTLEEEEK